jgi:hypothetical protein
MLTRPGEAGAGAFTIMRIAGHSSVSVSRQYVHPTPESLERPFERSEDLNSKKHEASAEELKRAAGDVFGVTTKSPTEQKQLANKCSQVNEFNREGP